MSEEAAWNSDGVVYCRHHWAARQLLLLNCVLRCNVPRYVTADADLAAAATPAIADLITSVVRQVNISLTRLLRNSVCATTYSFHQYICVPVSAH